MLEEKEKGKMGSRKRCPVMNCGRTLTSKLLLGRDEINVMCVKSSVSVSIIFFSFGSIFLFCFLFPYV